MILTDLTYTLSHASMQDCIEFLMALGQESLQFVYKGEQMNFEDLACIVGHLEYADSVGPVTFCAGPGQDDDVENEVFPMIEGTALHFTLDTILYCLAKDGPDVLAILEVAY
jgi:hypothetical protein